MAALGHEVMPQRRQRRVDRMQKPELRDLSRGEFSPAALFAARSSTREAFTFLSQNIEQSLKYREQLRARAQLQAWRNILRIVGEPPGAIANNARQWQMYAIACRLGIQAELNVLTSEV